MRVAERRSKKSIPREIRRPCSRCGHMRRELNGAFFRARRQAAKVTLQEIAPLFGSDGVSVELLSVMERGVQPFLPKYAAVYDRLFERRRRAGEPS